MKTNKIFKVIAVSIMTILLAGCATGHYSNTKTTRVYVGTGVYPYSSYYNPYYYPYYYSSFYPFFYNYPYYNYNYRNYYYNNWYRSGWGYNGGYRIYRHAHY